MLLLEGLPLGPLHEGGGGSDQQHDQQHLHLALGMDNVGRDIAIVAGKLVVLPILERMGVDKGTKYYSS